ncbi:MAG: tyrosine-type recombinase/integrase [Acidimicrobiia bacterium]|nr:tyrosine-type recombinase/integrase [Acidimicrobiia bacterium]
MASIRKVVHRTGRMSWQARWRDPTGGQRSKNFPRRIDAERFLVTVEARKLAGTYIDPRAGRLRLGDFTQQTTAGWVNRRDSTKARDESYLRSLVLPTFADMPIGAIGLFDVQEWIADLDAAGYAPATIRKASQLLERILNDAVNGGLIAASPCRDITLPKTQDTEKRFLSPEEITHLADTIHPRYHALVVTAAYTGCRIGELIALDVDRYQPDQRIIRIERSLAEVRGHLRFGQPKTAAARRAVSVPSWLPEVIDQHLATYPPGPDWLIFTAPEGGPIRRNTFRSRFWLPAVNDSVGQPMRFHDLRHSHVALLIAQGAHPAVIASRLGHTSVKTVLDVYGHLYEGLDRNAADTLNPPWNRSDVDATWTRRTRNRNEGRGLS